MCGLPERGLRLHQTHVIVADGVKRIAEPVFVQQGCGQHRVDHLALEVDPKALEPTHVIGCVEEDLVRRVVGYLLLEPAHDDAPVQISPTFVGNGQVGVKTFVCYGKPDDVSVSGSPPWTMGLEPWVFGFQINCNFRDAVRCRR